VIRAVRIPGAAAGTVEFFEGMERFLQDVHETEDRFQRAIAAKREGRYAAARDVLAPADPEGCIERLADYSQANGLTRGEMGLLVSLNTRWLSNYERLRQMVGLAPARYDFGPTDRDPLAQHRGSSAFAFDRNRRLWQVCGSHETGYDTYGEHDTNDDPAPGREVARTGLMATERLAFTVEPVHTGTYAGAPTFPPGRYRLSLFLPVADTADAGRSLDLRYAPRSGDDRTHYRLREPVEAGYLRIEDDADDGRGSIRAVEGPAIDPSPAAVTASGAEPGRGPGCVVDGDPTTRWVPAGPEPWLQFDLEGGGRLTEFGVDWYEGLSRDDTPTVLVSNDGDAWESVDIDVCPPPTATWETVTVEPERGTDYVRVDRELVLVDPSALDVELRAADGGVVRLGGLVLAPRE